jgi:LacI family transcriptional regulator
MTSQDGRLDAIPGRATIRDVSKAAGVSIKTVSRVLNNEKYVSAETRVRVEAIMASLQFQPSSAARALAGARSHQIALICDNPSPYYVYEVQSGVRLRCQRDRVRMIAQPYDRNSPGLLEDILSLIDQVHPDGLILTPPVTDYQNVLDALLERQMPFVRIQPGMQVDLTSSVYIDNDQAAFDMTRHLISLGHRRIGFIVGHRGYAASGQRLSGHLRALADAGIELDLDLVRQGNFDFASGAEAAEALLTTRRPPSAIFASSDDMAAGALATAHRLGLAVPGRVSIAGYDDTAFASIVWPALTTIRQPLRELAEAAADMLLASDGAVERRLLKHELVVRDSVGPAPV